MIFIGASFLRLLAQVIALIILSMFDNDSTHAIIDNCFKISLILLICVYPIFKDLLFPCGSIGCKAMNIKIIDQKTNLRPTKKKLILRGLFFYLYLIDFIVSYKRQDNNSLTDIITGTRLVSQTYYDAEYGTSNIVQ